MTQHQQPPKKEVIPFDFEELSKKSSHELNVWIDELKQKFSYDTIINMLHVSANQLADECQKKSQFVPGFCFSNEITDASFIPMIICHMVNRAMNNDENQLDEP